MNFNNERFELDGNQFSIEINNKKVILRYWNIETHTVKPIIEFSEGYINLLWSGEKQEIDYVLTYVNAAGAVRYFVEPFRTFSHVPELSHPLEFLVKTNFPGTFLEFVRVFLSCTLMYFNQLNIK